MKGNEFRRLGSRIACGAVAVLAGFLLMPMVASAAVVTVSLDGPGEGTVTSTPPGINCSNVGGGPPGPTCSFNFAGVIPVSLTAAGDDGSALGGWTGAPAANTGTCASGITNPCTFIHSFITSPPMSITATFVPEQAAAEVEIFDVDPESEDLTDSTVALKGSVNPTGDELTECRFEWVRQDDPDGFSSGAVGSAACDPEPGSVDEDVLVGVTATGLAANTPYRARLVAAKDVAGVVTDEAEVFTTRIGAPAAETLPAESLSPYRATLVGRVDPRNSDAEHWFEFTSPGGAVATLPATPAELDADAGPTVVSLDVTDLEPGGEYSYRVVAQVAGNNQLRSEGDDIVFETLSAAEANLPERGIELVSPLFTNAVGSYALMLSPDGNRAMFRATIPLPDSENVGFDWRVSERNPDGSWRVLPFKAGSQLVPAGQLSGGGSPLLSRGLSHAAYISNYGFDPADQNDSGDIYLRSPDTGENRWISPGPGIPSTAPGRADGERYVSDDGRRVIFTSVRQLLDTDITTNPTLYEWHDGEVRQIAFRPGEDDGPVLGSELGSGLSGNDNRGEVRNAVSRDGSRIAFTIGERELYVNDASDPDDVEIIEVRAPSAPEQAVYWGASSTLSTVVYTYEGQLYAFNLDVEPRTTQLINEPLPPGVSVRRALQVSDDGNRIYFATAPTGTTTGDVEHDLWVAERSGPEQPFEVGHIVTFVPDIGWRIDVTSRQYAASSDGGTLAFRSLTELVPGRKGGGRAQVYAYVRSRDAIYCLSCPSDGSNPSGADASLQRVTTRNMGGETSSSNRTSGFNIANPAPRVVSDDGTVIFQTVTPLTEQDSDENHDVYEWHGGEVSLVSSGLGGRVDGMSEISADGRTILFDSQVDLVPGIHESWVPRAYAARAGGGHPVDESPPKVDCQGAECREVAPSPPSLGRDTADGERAASSGGVGAVSCRPIARRLAIKRHALRRQAALTRRQLSRNKRADRGSATRTRSQVRRARIQVQKTRRARVEVRKLNRRLNSCRRAA